MLRKVNGEEKIIKTPVEEIEKAVEKDFEEKIEEIEKASAVEKAFEEKIEEIEKASAVEEKIEEKIEFQKVVGKVQNQGLRDPLLQEKTQCKGAATGKKLEKGRYFRFGVSMY